MAPGNCIALARASSLIGNPKDLAKSPEHGLRITLQAERLHLRNSIRPRLPCELLHLKVGPHVVAEPLAGADDQVLERVIDSSTANANQKISCDQEDGSPPICTLQQNLVVRAQILNGVCDAHAPPLELSIDRICGRRECPVRALPSTDSGSDHDLYIAGPLSA